MKQPKLKPKRVKGRIATLKAMQYEGCMVYIRRIDIELFEYLVVFNGQIYAGSMNFTPTEGKKDLTLEQVGVATSYLWTSATVTIDTLMGKKLDKETEELAKRLIN
jgi:hypothetical protein